MSEIRALPERPNLEFERKEAKELLRQLRAGDAAAIGRARESHPQLNGDTASTVRLADVRLADAQLVIAREYGFASWPRLVQYFSALERVARRTSSSWNSPMPPEAHLHAAAIRLIEQCLAKNEEAARTLAAYVPKFFGLSVQQVFELPVTEADAQLAVARRNGRPSWKALLARAAAERARPSSDVWLDTPRRRLWRVLVSGNLNALRDLVEEHPELLQPAAYDVSVENTLVSAALEAERVVGVEVMREMFDWIAVQGLDVQRTLNIKLCGHMYMKVEDARHWLDRGADPSWIAPNGISVLEHAIMRYWSGEAIDVVAERTTPRKALWVAAGLGDVEGVAGFLDANGKPTDRARADRPDFLAVGAHTLPVADSVDTQVLAEAFMLAFLNGRTAVLEHMVSRGFPVDSLCDGQATFLWIAVGNGWLPAVECLLRCGANLDLRPPRAQSTPREMAWEMLRQFPKVERHRRIAQLCGLDVEAELAAYSAIPATHPKLGDRVSEVLALANDDGARLGQTRVQPENLLFGLLRYGKLGAALFVQTSKMDFEGFRADFAERLNLVESQAESSQAAALPIASPQIASALEASPETVIDPAVKPSLPLSSSAQAIIDSAIAIATEHRREEVGENRLLFALIQDDDGFAARLLQQYGSTAERLRGEMQRSL